MDYEFTPPDGMELPEGAEIGKEFDMIGTWELKENGKMCVKAVGGLKLPSTESSSGSASYEDGPTAGDRAMMAMKEMRGAL